METSGNNNNNNSNNNQAIEIIDNDEPGDTTMTEIVRIRKKQKLGIVDLDDFDHDNLQERINQIQLIGVEQFNRMFPITRYSVEIIHDLIIFLKQLANIYKQSPLIFLKELKQLERAFFNIPVQYRSEQNNARFEVVYYYLHLLNQL